VISFIAEYYQLISVIFGVLATIAALIGIVYRITILNEARLKRKRDYKRDIESKITYLEKRMFRLDSDDGSINKLSDLCQSQIKSNKIAIGNAAYVRGRIDQMEK